MRKVHLRRFQFRNFDLLDFLLVSVVDFNLPRLSHGLLPNGGHRGSHLSLQKRVNTGF